MPNAIIVGSQWGDEGKAKVIDYLTERSDVIIRYQGGANAGHTVIADGTKFVFHMVPSGIMYPDKVCIVGNGVVFDAEQFLNEVTDLQAKGICVDNRLFVSDHAHLVLPYHKILDQATESSKGSQKIGTTGRGIGPAYADKASRAGLRLIDLVEWDGFIQKLRIAFDSKKELVTTLYHHPFELDFDTTVEQYRTIRQRLLPYIADTSLMLFNFSRENKSLLFEGAQGTFLDIDHGTYPFVTSSNTVAGSACAGSGIGPTIIDHCIGITKCYTTRVGNGPFPTELTDSTGEEIQRIGQEFGATTGRPRRCGWFDSVMVRKAVQLNGLTRLALTKLDVLSTLDEIRICTHYEVDGKRIDHMPSSLGQLEGVVPVYETHQGWKCDLAGCSQASDLPPNAMKYIRRLQELCYNIPILIISVGADRRQTIEVTPL